MEEIIISTVLMMIYNYTEIVNLLRIIEFTREFKCEAFSGSHKLIFENLCDVSLCE